MTHRYRAHPVWGRPIDEYTASYDLAAAQKRKAVTRKGEAESVEAIRSVSRLAGQTHAAQSEEMITIQTLESILQLTLSPRTFHHFAHPPLVSGCVRLLSTVKPEGWPSPFSYEFGYLCFKILTLAVGACILQRSNNLDSTTSRMSSELDTGLLLIFSDSVAQAVNARIQLGMFGGACDWVLDWVEGMGSQRGASVPQSDVRAILGILWEDRELFLKAFANTYTPGPSGILFLLWRHLHFERVFDSQPPSKLAAPFCEILWRYMIVFTRDQGDTLILLQKHLQASGATNVWDASPKTVTLSDLKNLIQLYSDRLPMSHSALSPSLNIGIIPTLLKFVCHLAGARPGAEESYPLLVERTLERVCDTLTLETERDDFEARFGYAQTLFSLLAVLFEHMENNKTYDRNQAGQRAVLGVLKALKRLGILDLILRMFLMFTPPSDGRVDYKISSTFMLQVVSTMIRKISAIAPKYVIGTTFEYYIPDWIKFHEHLLYLANAAPTTSGPQMAHLESCCHVWRELAETLRIYHRIGVALSNPLSCSYSTPADVNELGVVGPPVARLPEDLLLRIFLLGKELEDSPLRGFRRWRSSRQTRFAILIAQICRKWRSLAINSPLLWNRIVITGPKSFDYASLFLERSGPPTLIEIEIDIMQYAFAVGRDELAARGALYSAGYSELRSMKDEPKLAKQILDFLIDKGADPSRWVELSVRVASLEPLYAVVKFLSTANSRLDRLRELALVNQRGKAADYEKASRYKQSETFLFRNPPFVHTIRVIGIDDHFLFAQTHISQFSNLTTLDLAFIGIDVPSLRCIRSALAHSPRLETLALNTKAIYATPGFPAWNSLDEDLEGTKINLPHLRKLSFQDLELADWGVDILQMIDAPNLEIFAVILSESGATGRMDPIASYIAYGTTDVDEDSQSKKLVPYRPTFPLLRHLTLIACFTDSLPVDALLRSLSTVTRLDWLVAIRTRNPPSFDSFFAVPGCCLNLEHLRIAGVPADQLIKGIDSLIQAGTPFKTVKVLNWQMFNMSEQAEISQLCKRVGSWTGEVSYDDPYQD